MWYNRTTLFPPHRSFTSGWPHDVLRVTQHCATPKSANDRDLESNEVAKQTHQRIPLSTADAYTHPCSSTLTWYHEVPVLYKERVTLLQLTTEHDATQHNTSPSSPVQINTAPVNRQTFRWSTLPATSSLLHQPRTPHRNLWTHTQHSISQLSLIRYIICIFVYNIFIRP